MDRVNHQSHESESIPYRSEEEARTQLIEALRIDLAESEAYADRLEKENAQLIEDVRRLSVLGHALAKGQGIDVRGLFGKTVKPSTDFIRLEQENARLRNDLKELKTLKVRAAVLSFCLMGIGSILLGIWFAPMFR